MQLYEIRPYDHHLVHVVARTPQEAVELFVTWFIANGHQPSGFAVDALPVENLGPKLQAQVRGAFGAGLVGICHYSEELGWTFSPPLWQPVADDEMTVENVEGTH